MPTFSNALLAIVVIALATAALMDAMQRRIANELCVAVAVAGAALNASRGLGHLVLAVVGAACVFLPLVALWRRKLLGSGDVKLATAATLATGLSGLPACALTVALAGGVLAATMWLTSLAKHAAVHRSLGLAAGLARPTLPYGVAIAAGASWTLLTARG